MVIMLSKKHKNTRTVPVIDQTEMFQKTCFEYHRFQKITNVGAGFPFCFHAFTKRETFSCTKQLKLFIDKNKCDWKMPM